MEIVTLQFGHFSNFVGAHFWNTQEKYFSFDTGQHAQEIEVLHDTLFRAGVTQNGIETYTPRLMIYDLKGGFGSIKKMNKLYDEISDYQKNCNWSWKSETYAQAPYPKNEYLQNLEEEEEKGISAEYADNMDNMEVDSTEKDFHLDETVKMWSDFNRIYYHPRSINTISNYSLGDDSMPFDVFSYGKNAYFSQQKEEDSFEENFRFFIEECDTIQGFQVMTNIIDGFGGFTCSFIERLREEYPKTPVISFGITDGQEWSPIGHRRYFKQIMNSSLSTIYLSELSSLFIPLNVHTNFLKHDSTKFIQPTINLPYHSSCVLSAAIETSTFPFRSRRNTIHMHDFVTRLNWHGNTKIGTLDFAFPLPMNVYGDIDTQTLLSNDDRSVLNDLSFPPEPHTSTVYGQSVVVRGIPDEFRAVSGTEKKKSSDVTSDIFARFQSLGGYSNSFFASNVFYPIPNSFPNIFKNLNTDGYIDESAKFIDTHPIHFAPTLSHITISTRVQKFLQNYKTELQKVNFNFFPEFDDGNEGLSHDDFLEAKESLNNLCEVYEDG
ncbi:tubulin nucleotide-binding domain-like protein [Gigaspora margarita]|uniref:Tubulin nucleotide-binding domain-like protein n=1 Tax=Gigaspora margarita TaxID=4874 RepID=A0A8H3X8Q5_GIGMA|nr:tubulin nucleotide-binding domain-like protein [Gigaspora margarita]